LTGELRLAGRKREEATVSFHYLVLEKRAAGKAAEIVDVSEAQFTSFCDRLLAQPDIDLTNDETCNRLKAAVNSPVERCEMVDDRTVFGRFRSLYTGHAYDNTDVGEIPDSSVSLRPFFFLAYLSESGRIYIASQYLGPFGGYRGLYRTLRLFLPQDHAVISHSFRHDATSYKDAKPKEVRVNFSRKPKEITGTTKFGQRGAMTFKRGSSKDEEFNTTVSTKILAKLGNSDAVLKKAVADMITDNEMLILRDEDIEDCTVVATVNGRNQTINVIEAGHFATRFPLDIAEYVKGHPDKEKAKAGMLKLLKEQIIARSERV
jgi:hypothetical protein